MGWHFLLEKWLHFYFTILINYIKVSGINCNIWPSHVRCSPCDLAENISGPGVLCLGGRRAALPAPTAIKHSPSNSSGRLGKGQGVFKFYRDKDSAFNLPNVNMQACIKGFLLC